MAQGNRSSQPKTTCCRCRRRAEGMSRLTNLGWLCDNCYDLLHRSALGRRIYRMVYQLSSRRAPVVLPERPASIPARAAAGRGTSAPRRTGEPVGASPRDEEEAPALVAKSR